MRASMAHAAKVWRHRTGEVVLDRTRIMGVLNVTPDSFSDGGQFSTTEKAVARALAMVEEGADIVDIGGESTRPHSNPVPADEEWRRIGSVIETVARKVDTPISVDTRKSEIASKSLKAGASIVNDITGLQNPTMVRVVARAHAGAVIMHMLGDPKTMQEDPHYEDVVRDVRDVLRARAKGAEAGGVAHEALAVDPGIGFGKTLEHNLAVLSHIESFAALGYPVVVGASRKSFLLKLGAGAGARDDRLPGSLAAATLAVARGAHVIRAHDVLETVRAMRVADAVLHPA
jgi:dihydropteroate synthase